MTVFRMALRSLRQRLLATCLTASSIALGVALVVAVLVLVEARAGVRLEGAGRLPWEPRCRSSTAPTCKGRR